MGFRVNQDEIKTSYTHTLSEFTADLTYDSIPPEVRERAKFIAMQTVGVGLAAKGTPIGERSVALGRFTGGVVSEGGATLWTTGEKSSVAGAAFCNSTLADALDWEDCSWTGHPSASIVPVAFAVAEAEHKSGKDYITAIVAAYEVYQRIAMAVQPPENWPNYKGWGLTSWQVFAGVVPAARLIGLTPDQINQAFGFGVLCCPIQSNLHHITMSDAYHYEHGFRAKDGILAALTAKAGVENYMDCFDDTYSFDFHMTREPKRDWYTKDLGSRWLTSEVLIKHWPANMWLQTPIELVHNITTKYNIGPDDIAEIVLDPPTQGRMFFDPAGFNSLTQAQFSGPFMIAAYLLNPVPGPKWFDLSMLRDPKILELAAKVKSGPAEPHIINLCFKGFQRGEFPMKTVTITTKDGKSYSESMDCHPGHPRNMMSHGEFCDRFRIAAAPTLEGEKMERAIQALSHLEDCQDITELNWIFSA